MNDKLEMIRAFLAAQTTLVLATCGTDGLPRSTPVFYVAGEELRLYWFSSRTSLHSRNCAHRPEVSVSISAEAVTWQQIRGVQMQGVASMVTARALRKRITAAYVERFALGNLFSMAIRQSSLYCFTPRWVRYLDNTKKFGHKLEVELAAQPLSR